MGLVRCAVGFGRRIKGMIRLGPEQVWKDNVTRNVTTVRSSALLFIPDNSVLKSGANRYCWVVSWTFLYLWYGVDWGKCHRIYRNAASVPTFLEQKWLSWTLCPYSRSFSPIKLIKNSNSLGDILVKSLYNPLTVWKSLPANLNRCIIPCLCTVAFATTTALFFFSLKRNVRKKFGK